MCNEGSCTENRADDILARETGVIIASMCLQSIFFCLFFFRVFVFGATFHVDPQVRRFGLHRLNVRDVSCASQSPKRTFEMEFATFKLHARVLIFKRKGAGSPVDVDVDIHVKICLNMTALRCHCRASSKSVLMGASFFFKHTIRLHVHLTLLKVSKMSWMRPGFKHAQSFSHAKNWQLLTLQTN